MLTIVNIAQHFYKGTENTMATTQQSGFAPAASPLASTIVQTPDDAIVAGFTSIPSQGDNMPAYHARPKQSDGPLPVVIVVQEIFGVHEHIRDIVAVWRWRGIWLSHQNSTSAKAILMISPIFPRC